ncbi:nucleotide exchange factor GrpE [Halopenitus sp. H-Gu1]|uniref:nucleotide exchange factor GrpE n=1 Tax=Halopenitus sp. H-Gu1 TaxID=3242697 RepID=UPI00359E5D93
MSEDDAVEIEFEDEDRDPSTSERDDTGGDVDAERDGESDVNVEDDATTEESHLAARIADLDAEDADTLAEEVADLEARLEERESRIETLEDELDDRDAEIDDLTERLKRKQADFQNYKQRAKRRQEEIKERAAEDLIERIVPVRDNLLRALDQEAGTDIRPGVESTLGEFDRVLEEENVETIDPEPGQDVDPRRHQVMLRVESDQPEGTIAEVYQPGYELDGSVIREAQVTVSDGQ